MAYPELKKFCEKQGLGCHVVDLRHGTSRLKNSRETFDVIQRELFKCQKYSIGPCFVVSVMCLYLSKCLISLNVRRSDYVESGIQCFIDRLAESQSARSVTGLPKWQKKNRPTVVEE